MDNAQKYLTTGEAADLLRCAAQTLRVWRLRGTGPRFMRAGGRVLYAQADVIAWLEATAAISTA